MRNDPSSPCASEDTRGFSKPKSKSGLIVFGVVSAATAGLLAVTASFISPALRKICLPFVPATDVQLENIFKALRQPIKVGCTLVDIGSGDGRVVIKAAEHGYKAVGYELNIWLILYSKFRSWRLGLYRDARFQRRDLWKADYSQFDNVVVFGVEQMMPQLEAKLMEEMKPGSKLLACRFPFPSLPVRDTNGTGVDTVWTYYPSPRDKPDARETRRRPD